MECPKALYKRGIHHGNILFSTSDIESRNDFSRHCYISSLIKAISVTATWSCFVIHQPNKVIWWLPQSDMFEQPRARFLDKRTFHPASSSIYCQMMRKPWQTNFTGSKSSRIAASILLISSRPLSSRDLTHVQRNTLHAVNEDRNSRQISPGILLPWPLITLKCTRYKAFTWTRRHLERIRTDLKNWIHQGRRPKHRNEQGADRYFRDGHNNMLNSGQLFELVRPPYSFFIGDGDNRPRDLDNPALYRNMVSLGEWFFTWFKWRMMTDMPTIPWRLKDRPYLQLDLTPRTTSQMSFRKVILSRDSALRNPSTPTARPPTQPSSSRKA